MNNTVETETLESLKAQNNALRKKLELYTGNSGAYECFHCCTRSVIWDSDFSFEDYGYDGDGIVHSCHCTNCGAEIEYRIPLEDDSEEEKEAAE